MTTLNFKMCYAILLQLCLILCKPRGLLPARLFCPWDSPGKNTGVGSHCLLQGFFPTQGSNEHFLPLLHRLYHCAPWEALSRVRCLSCALWLWEAFRNLWVSFPQYNSRHHIIKQLRIPQFQFLNGLWVSQRYLYIFGPGFVLNGE